MTPTATLALTPDLSTPGAVKDAINHYATRFDVDADIMIEVIKCESGFNPTAVGDHGKAYGLGQFWLGTFNTFAKAMGAQDYNYYDPLDQLEVMAWAFSHGLAHHWSCFNALHSKYLARA